MVAIDSVVTGRRDLDQRNIPLHSLPDELLLHILWFLDIPDLYAISRVGSNPDEPEQRGLRFANTFRRHIICERFR